MHSTDRRLLAAVTGLLCALFALTSLDTLIPGPFARAGVARLLGLGCLDRRVLAGDTWQAFTHMWLHGSLLHLVCNATSLATLVHLARTRLSHGRWFAVYLATGLVAGPLHVWLRPVAPPDFRAWTGPLAAYFWKPGTPLIGASGAISGLWGALAALAVLAALRREPSGIRAGRAELGVAWLVLPFVLQVAIDARTPGIAGLAHAAGFVAGALLIAGVEAARYLPPRFCSTVP